MADNKLILVAVFAAILALSFKDLFISSYTKNDEQNTQDINDNNQNAKINSEEDVAIEKEIPKLKFKSNVQTLKFLFW